MSPPDTPHPRLKRQARQLRREEGLTVRVIADVLGVPRATVGDWIRDCPRVIWIECRYCGKKFTYASSEHVGREPSCCSPEHTRLQRNRTERARTRRPRRTEKAPR